MKTANRVTLNLFKAPYQSHADLTYEGHKIESIYLFTVGSGLGSLIKVHERTELWNSVVEHTVAHNVSFVRIGRVDAVDRAGRYPLTNEHLDTPTAYILNGKDHGCAVYYPLDTKLGATDELVFSLPSEPEDYFRHDYRMYSTVYRTMFIRTDDNVVKVRGSAFDMQEANPLADYAQDIHDLMVEFGLANHREQPCLYHLSKFFTDKRLVTLLKDASKAIPLPENTGSFITVYTYEGVTYHATLAGEDRTTERRRRSIAMHILHSDRRNGMELDRSVSDELARIERDVTVHRSVPCDVGTRSFRHDYEHHSEIQQAKSYPCYSAANSPK